MIDSAIAESIASLCADLLYVSGVEIPQLFDTAGVGALRRRSWPHAFDPHEHRRSATTAFPAAILKVIGADPLVTFVGSQVTKANQHPAWPTSLRRNRKTNQSII